ncbi:AbrB/MazE/SpoVT family DNA-binding domain-containing protein [Stygiolobus caldivivus]|uniref:AbrB family transcriptional regulator n=1 Tax=Stygiolobus caldivivus TaxID=2824673 RepID=A0A8D5U8N2_9CREN|nr:AbrB/MazE/SpoVT family DNA-binding domain-containing protein [Stygiolobus caldivivus]BCU71247.1 AbrB family transcriptional regulator [Stygiolobus caldivivus]
MTEETNKSPKDVETRKVQRLGSSSLFITLPKKWINKWGIKPGDKIIMEISEDGTLRLVAEKVKVNYNRRNVRVDIDSYKQPMVTAIPCLYILGYDEIMFTSKKNIDPKEFEDVINYSKHLVGIEVAETNENSIKLDCLLDTEKIGAESLLRRILNIASRKVDEILAYLKGQQINEVQPSIEDLKRVQLMLLRRSMGGRYTSERDTLRNFIIAINSIIILRVYNIMTKLSNFIKNTKSSLTAEQIKILTDMFQKINDLFDEIIMTILFPSVKRISNGYNIISQLKQGLEQLNIQDLLIKNYLEELVQSLEEALTNSSCSIFLEELPWIERNFNA